MIRKALIPIAGEGRRLHPLTKAVPKAMLPLPSRDGRLLPVVHLICAEAAAGGVEQALLIVSPSQEKVVRVYFEAARSSGSPELPAEIEILVQPLPAGFGEAVSRGRSFVGDEPFLLLLGDHVYAPAPGGRTCVEQVTEAFDRFGGTAMVGMQAVGADELPRVGVARGEPIEDRLYRCTDIVEKPDPSAAAQRLATPGLEEGQFLAHCGIYVFAPQIFESLSALTARPRPGGEEIELTDAQAMLLERRPDDYLLYRIDGRAYDTGTVSNYIRAFAAFADASAEV